MQFLLFSGECKIDLLSCAEREMRLEWEFSQEGWTDYDGSNFPFLPSWPTPICWQQIPFNGRQIHLLKISSWLDPGNKKKKQYLVFGNPSVIQSKFSLDGATVVCRISLNLSLKYEFVSKNQNGLLVVLIIFNFFSFTLSHSSSAYFPMLYLRKGFVLRIRVQTHGKNFFLHKDTHPRWQGFYVFWQHIPGKEVQLMSNNCPPRKFLWWILLKCIQTIRLDSTGSWRRQIELWMNWSWILICP